MSTYREQWDKQKYNAKRRGIPFLLTYKQWYGIWKRSGHLPERGKGTNRYCMARFHDRGAYEIGNVHIITHQQNSRDYEATPEHRAAKSRALKGVPKSREHRKALARAMKNRAPFSETTKQKMSAAAKLRVQRMPLSAEHMRKMRAARGGNSTKTRLKISRSNRGRIGGFTGKRHSEATKALKRQTWRNQYDCGEQNGHV